MLVLESTDKKWSCLTISCHFSQPDCPQSTQGLYIHRRTPLENGECLKEKAKKWEPSRCHLSRCSDILLSALWLSVLGYAISFSCQELLGLRAQLGPQVGAMLCLKCHHPSVRGPGQIPQQRFQISPCLSSHSTGTARTLCTELSHSEQFPKFAFRSIQPPPCR